MDQTESTEAQSNEPGSSSPAMKIAVVLREDLEPWQRLNVASFTVSGVTSQAGAVGESYRDGSHNTYLPMFKDPVLVFGATTDEMARTIERSRSRGVLFSIFTEDLFNTFNDLDNRAAVAAVAADKLRAVAIAFRCDQKIADKVLKGLKLLK